MITLRPYQEDAIKRIRGELAQLEPEKRRVVLQMATGAGKTAVASTIAMGAVERGKRILFICDTLELIQQALDTFDRVGLPVGVMQAQHPRTDLSRKVQVCSQATVASWLKSDKLHRYDVDLIVIDECHVQYKVRDTLAETYPTVPIIGLTATPFARGMGLFYEKCISVIGIGELIDQGYLTGFKAFTPSTPDMKGVKKKGNDYDVNQAADRYDPVLVADIVKTWMEHGYGRRTLMFCCNVAHSKRMVEEFQAHGVNAVHVDGYPQNPDEAEDRHQKIQRYRDGEIEILSSVALCTKGFDAPETDCLIFARPTQSLSLHWQMFGRGLRIAEGKEDLLVLDHAGNIYRHGFPTDEIDLELDKNDKPVKEVDKRDKEAPLPTPCPACNYPRPAGVHQCPACQFIPEKQDEIINVAGELVLLEEYKASQSKGKKKVWTKEEKQDFYSGLLTIAFRRGYSDGWVSHTYRDMFKVWPQGLDKVRNDPSMLVEKYVRHKAIAYAKAKGKNKPPYKAKRYA